MVVRSYPPKRRLFVCRFAGFSYRSFRATREKVSYRAMMFVLIEHRAAVFTYLTLFLVGATELRCSKDNDNGEKIGVYKVMNTRAPVQSGAS